MKTKHVIVMVVCSAALFSGCSTTVDIKPEVQVSDRQMVKHAAIGYYHSPEFRNYRYSADVYGNKHMFLFPLGPSSDALMKSLYPKVFKEVEVFNAMPAEAGGSPNVAAVLVPEIESFQFPLQSLMGPYWAEIEYRFTLYALKGEKLISWTTKGWGEGGDGTRYGEFGPIADATNMAMQKAAMKFVKSFKHMPEVKRWETGKSLEGATANPDMQTVRSIPGDGKIAFEAGYPGVVAIRGNLNADPSADNPQGKKTLEAVGIRAVALEIRNEGNTGILVDPLSMAWVSDGEKETSPLSVSLIASVLTSRYPRVNPGPAGTGAAAIPGLLISLYNAAAMMDEEKQIKENLAAFRRREMKETWLSPAETIAGLVYFPMPETTPGGELRIPVIDAEKAVRYILHVPAALP